MCCRRQPTQSCWKGSIWLEARLMPLGLIRVTGSFPDSLRTLCPSFHFPWRVRGLLLPASGGPSLPASAGESLNAP